MIRSDKDILCNACGKSQRIAGTDQFYRDVVEVDHGWGYGTPQDQTIIRFKLCESCIEGIVATFKIPAERSKYDGPLYLSCRTCAKAERARQEMLAEKWSIYISKKKKED